jgi:hypothetical protein
MIGIGSRVRVKIKRPQHYAVGLLKNGLDGSIGTVEKASDKEFRVKFDKPIDRGLKYWPALHCLWIPVDELEAIE